MEQLSPQLMHKLVFTVLMHGLNDTQAGLAHKLLIDALSHSHPQVRELAVVALADLAVPHPKRVMGLLIALKDDAPRVRRRAARALGDQGIAAQEAISQLVEGLADPDASVRRDCAGTLGRLGPGAFDGSAGLVKMLLDPEARTRAVAGVSLRRIGRAALPAVVAGAKSVSAELRARCVTQLGMIAPESPDVAAVIRAAVGDADAEVRGAAEKALRNCPPAPVVRAGV